MIAFPDLSGPLNMAFTCAFSRSIPDWSILLTSLIAQRLGKAFAGAQGFSDKPSNKVRPALVLVRPGQDQPGERVRVVFLATVRRLAVDDRGQGALSPRDGVDRRASRRQPFGRDR